MSDKSSETHIKMSDLLAFVDGHEQKETERNLCVSHLAHCAECRTVLSSLMTYKNGLAKLHKNNFEPIPINAQCLPRELMGDFLGHRLPEQEQTNYSNHIADCDDCFERAAFFSSSATKMAEGVLLSGATPDHIKELVMPRNRPLLQPDAEIIPIGKRLRDWFTLPVPAYAMAALLALALLAPFGDNSGRVLPLTSETHYSLYKQPTQAGPSFGFSDAGQKTGKTEVTFTYTIQDNGDLLIGWTPVIGSSGYAVVVNAMTTTGPEEVLRNTRSEANLLIPQNRMTPGVAYQFRITGVTPTSIGDEQIFATTGQFTLTP